MSPFTPIAATVVYDASSITDLANHAIRGNALAFEWNLPAWKEIAHAFEVAAASGACTQHGTLPSAGQPQPKWDINDPDKAPKETEETERDGKTREGTWTKRDLIAWYAPANFHKPANYGIHFDAPKVKQLAETLAQKARESGNASACDETDWLITAIFVCYWHEACHGWVEDLCSLISTITAEDRYKEAELRYGCYIEMEEALCNTVALWMLATLWDDKAKQQAILAAARAFMEGQGPGYRDFGDFGRWKSNRDRLKKNMARLLDKVYGFDPSTGAIEHALNVFFGDDRFDTSQSEARCDAAAFIITNLYMRHDSFPIRVHAGA